MAILSLFRHPVFPPPPPTAPPAPPRPACSSGAPAAPLLLSLRFIFRGYGAIWLEVTDRRPVAFTNLPPPTPSTIREPPWPASSHFRARASAHAATLIRERTRTKSAFEWPEWTRLQRRCL